MFGERHGGVVPRREQQPIEQFSDWEFLARFQARGGPRRGVGPLRKRHDFVEYGGIFLRERRDQKGGHDLRGACRIAPLVFVGTREDFARFAVGDRPSLARHKGRTVERIGGLLGDIDVDDCRLRRRFLRHHQWPQSLPGRHIDDSGGRQAALRLELFHGTFRFRPEVAVDADVCRRRRMRALSVRCSASTSSPSAPICKVRAMAGAGVPSLALKYS